VGQQAGVPRGEGLGLGGCRTLKVFKGPYLESSACSSMLWESAGTPPMLDPARKGHQKFKPVQA
jgi:hypothetical protein